MVFNLRWKSTLFLFFTLLSFSVVAGETEPPTEVSIGYPGINVLNKDKYPGDPSTKLSHYEKELLNWSRYFFSDHGEFMSKLNDKEFSDAFSKIVSEEIRLPDMGYDLQVVVGENETEELTTTGDDYVPLWDVMRSILLLETLQHSVRTWEQEFIIDGYLSIDVEDAKDRAESIFGYYNDYVGNGKSSNPLVTAIFGLKGAHSWGKNLLGSSGAIESGVEGGVKNFLISRFDEGAWDARILVPNRLTFKGFVIDTFKESLQQSGNEEIPLLLDVIGILNTPLKQGLASVMIPIELAYKTTEYFLGKITDVAKGAQLINYYYLAKTYPSALECNSLFNEYGAIKVESGDYRVFLEECDVQNSYYSDSILTALAKSEYLLSRDPTVYRNAEAVGAIFSIGSLFAMVEALDMKELKKQFVVLAYLKYQERKGVNVTYTFKSDSDYAPSTYQFDASSSKGLPEGTSYCWNFGDGTAYCGEPIESHTYTDIGKYKAKLTVEVDLIDYEYEETLEVKRTPSTEELLEQSSVLVPHTHSGVDTEFTFLWAVWNHSWGTFFPDILQQQFNPEDIFSLTAQIDVGWEFVGEEGNVYVVLQHTERGVEKPPALFYMGDNNVLYPWDLDLNTLEPFKRLVFNKEESVVIFDQESAAQISEGDWKVFVGIGDKQDKIVATVYQTAEFTITGDFPKPLQILDWGLPVATLGEPYSAQIFVRFGNPPYSWHIEDKSPRSETCIATGKGCPFVPEINSRLGVLGGINSSENCFVNSELTVTVTDAEDNVIQKDFQLVVEPSDSSCTSPDSVEKSLELLDFSQTDATLTPTLWVNGEIVSADFPLITADSINLHVDIGIASSDVGQSGVIFVVMYDGQAFSMRNDAGEWQTWDGNPEHLVPFTHSVPLQALESVLALEDFGGSAGEFLVYIGYENLETKRVVYNSTPIVLNISEPVTEPTTTIGEVISAGYGFTCGIKTDGNIVCWGEDDEGLTPPEGNFSQVSARVSYACGLKMDGSVVCWDVSDKTYKGQADPPVDSFTQIATGQDHSCGVKIDGNIVCWGNSPMNPLPTGSYKQVSVHANKMNNDICGLQTDGKVVCWGFLGRDGFGLKYPVDGNFIQISVGYTHSCGVRIDGSIVCWGSNDKGQTEPPVGNFIQISAGYNHTCGVRTDGSVSCWGDNDDSKATPPDGNFSQVSSGSTHTCGLKIDGSVVCWGNNDFGQATPPNFEFGVLKPTRPDPTPPIDRNRPFQDPLKDGGLGPEMVWIPAGEFQMGDIQGVGSEDELPVHWVSVERFAMGRYEVTFAEYDRFAEATGREKPNDESWGRDNRPVINISWHDAVAYTEWLSEQTGHTYRLPTEAEWEYAARAGTETNYWWGNEIGENHANCNGCGSQWDGKQTAPVGSFAPNPFGLYDTAGNVWEWVCSSGYIMDKDILPGFYSGVGYIISEPKELTCDMTNEGRRIMRDGSWNNIPYAVRSAGRTGFNLTYRNNQGGFRVVMSPL